MKEILTDTGDFEKLITQDKVYVDKTAYFHRLIDGSIASNFFISRPRRFGKSLMLSTLEAIFRGRRDLFERDGEKLAIAKTDYDWKPHPIIRLDMSGLGSVSFERTEECLVRQLKDIAGKLRLSIDDTANPQAYFADMLRAFSGENQVVVLVDEYDAPLQGLLSDESRLEQMRQALHDFYTLLKTYGSGIRFLMMTGVSRFARLSLNSGFNNPEDITMRAEFAGMLGYTREELSEYFGEHVRALAERRGETPGRLFDELVDWYDGYRFSPESETKVLNPVSVGKALSSGVLRNYWIETGASSLVWERLKAARRIPEDLEGIPSDRDETGVYDADSVPTNALLYQGGYLTIKEGDDGMGGFILGIPNREVRQSADKGFARSLFPGGSLECAELQRKVRRQLASGDAEGLVNESVAAFFALIPHSWRIGSEAEAKRYFHLFFALVGADVRAEVQSSRGTADMVLKTRDVVYVFEFKYGKTAEAALGQIDEKGYAGPYAADGRRVIRVGVNYLPEKRTVQLAGK